MNAARTRIAILLGALLSSLPLACGSQVDFELERDTPVVLIIIDTLRADHMGVYDYELDNTPVLSEFAKTAYQFDANSTQCNSTFPSITSIMTGLYPKTHRNYVPVPLEGTTVANTGTQSWAERMKSVDYHALAAVSHPVWTSEDVNTAVRRSWDEFSTIPAELPRSERNELDHAGFTNERGFALLDGYEKNFGDKPLFLWMHYFDPHTEYAPPVGYRDRYLEHHLKQAGLEDFLPALTKRDPKQRKVWISTKAPKDKVEALRLANGRALYDEEILYCDYEIGRLFDRLREMDVYDDALIVVMADHGENMEPAEWGHGRINFTHQRLYEGVAATPLLIRLPGQAEGIRITQLTQNIDVLPTVMELLNLPAGSPVEGRSLVSLMREPQQKLHERVYIEASDNVEKAIKTDEIKFIDPGVEDALAEVYRWRQDKEESEDLVGSLDEEVVGEFTQWMGDFRIRDCLRIRIEPAKEPYSIDMTMQVLDTTIDRVLGLDKGIVSEDGHSLRFQGQVTETLEAYVFMAKRESTIIWELETSLPGAGHEHVFLGRLPISSSAAIPVFSATESEGHAQPVLDISSRSDGFDFELQVDPAQLTEFEFRLKDRLELRRMEWGGGTGFEQTYFDDGRMGDVGTKTKLKLQSTGVERPTAKLDVQGDPESVIFLLRSDGQWPDFERVRLNGKAVETTRLQFVLPAPPDGRILSAMFTGPEENPPPGAIQIWLESGAGPVGIDGSSLDPELAEQLRALGYLR